MKKRGRKPLKKEEIAEDWCFHCKDGGELLICDYKQCLKAYHSNCAGVDDSFLASANRWDCNWHFCHLCDKASYFQCYSCPKAVCKFCISSAEFVHVRGKNGLCTHCLRLALLVEEDMDVDSDGEKVDLKNRETYEGLFKEYYELIKEKIGLNLKVLRAAKSRLIKGQNCPHDSDSDECIDDHEGENMVSDYENMDDSDSDGSDLSYRKKRSKKKHSSKQTKGRSCKKHFVGWGSSSLIQFLSSIGKDTSQKMSPLQVTKIIEKYARENELFHPEKKRKIVCDARLRDVLGRKIVNVNGIKNLLEVHFAENQEDSWEDTVESSSEEEEATPMAGADQRTLKTDEEFSKIEGVATAVQSCFAAIVAENIKLVFLKKSLVYELAKGLESFEDKVTGSFVRVKADPDDAYLRNSHQLMQVTGIQKTSEGDENAEIILLVSEVPNEVRIRMLSNDDFTEAECEDLRSRVKAGLVKKPTVVELEHKARILHQDIMTHWITKELELLQKLIDRANEKGWRRELFGYMERKRLLQSSTEKERLLGNMPVVIPEMVDSKPANEDMGDDKDKGSSATSTLFSVPHNKCEGVHQVSDLLC